MKNVKFLLKAAINILLCVSMLFFLASNCLMKWKNWVLFRNPCKNLCKIVCLWIIKSGTQSSPWPFAKRNIHDIFWLTFFPFIRSNFAHINHHVSHCDEALKVLTIFNTHTAMNLEALLQKIYNTYYILYIMLLFVVTEIWPSL